MQQKKKKSRSIADPVMKALYGRSANRCNSCKTEVTELPPKEGDNVTNIGEIGHINAYASGGPRPNQEMENINSYENLILLCRNCHGRIDRQEISFTRDELIKIKENHEAEVKHLYSTYMVKVDFTELKMVTDWLLKNQSFFEDDEALVSIPIPPNAKIKKNDLTTTSKDKISLGMLKSKEVASFIEFQIKMDSEFPDKLKYGFLEEYARLRKEGYKGDDLFEAMHLFASNNSPKYEMLTAGLALLSYFFEICEVFEK